MSNLSWCDLNNEGNLIKIHDMCPNPKCKCRKQITFNANQFQIEGSVLKKTMKKIFKGPQKAWDYFLNEQ